MTTTIILWVRIAVYFFIGYTVFTFAKAALKRKSIIPKQKAEWLGALSDLVFMVLAVFLLITIQKNYLRPMETLMQYNGKELPAFSYVELPTLKETNLRENKSPIVILNIWATWCSPCRKEMPHLNKIQKVYGSEGVKVIAISDEDPSVVKNFLSNEDYQFTTGTFLQPNQLLNNIETRPVSILLVDGKVKNIVIGAKGYSFFKRWVKNAL